MVTAAPTMQYISNPQQMSMWNSCRLFGNRFFNLSFGDGCSIWTNHIVDTVLGSKTSANARMWERAGGTGLKGFWSATKDGWKKIPNNKNVFQNIASRFKEIPAATKGTKGWWSKIKVGGSKLGPLATVLLIAGFEIPNVYKAFTHKDGGVGTGTLEAGKATLKTGASMAGFAVGSAAGGALGAKVGAAVGTAICPGVGSLVGGIIGFAGGIIGSMIAGKVADTFLGKSFSEKVEEKEQAQQQELAQQQALLEQQQQALTGGTSQTNPFQYNPFAFDSNSNPTNMYSQYPNPMDMYSPYSMYGAMTPYYV